MASRIRTRDRLAFLPRARARTRRGSSVVTVAASVLCAAVLLSASTGAVPEAPGIARTAGDQGSRVRGGVFEVVLDFEHDELARQAAEAAEAVWNTAVEKIGAPAEPARQRTVYLHLKRAAYEAACDEFVGGSFKRNGAFSSHATGHAHVLVEPGLPDHVRERIGLPYATRRLIQHEAAHLAVYETYEHFRSHPKWLAEGLATWLEHTTAAADAKADGVAVQPRSLEAVKNARPLAREGTLPLPVTILGDGLGRMPFYERYAVQTLWFRWLVEERPKATERFLRALARRRRMPTGPAGTRAVRTMLERALGSRGLSRAARDFPEWLSGLPLPWEQLARSLEFRAGGEWVQSAFRTAHAAAVRPEVQAPPYTLRGAVEILGGEPARSGPEEGQPSETAQDGAASEPLPTIVQQANLRFGARSAGDFVQLAFRRDLGGSVTLFRCEEGVWNRAAYAPCPDAADGRVAFEVVVDAGGTVEVVVDGVPVLQHAVPAADLRGGLGVGCQRGATVVWSGVELPAPR